MALDPTLVFFLALVPAIMILIVQYAANKTEKVLPNIGLDAHAAAVAMLVSVTALTAKSKPSIPSPDLIIAHLLILIVVLFLMAVTAIWHTQKKIEICNFLGIMSLAGSIIWVYVVVESLVVY